MTHRAPGTVMRAVLRLYRDAFAGLPAATWLLTSVALVHRAGAMALGFFTLHATEGLGLDEQAAGRALAAFGLGAIAGNLLGGRLADRFDPVRVQLGAFLTNALLWLVVGQATTFWPLAAAMALAGLAAETFRPANGAALATTCRPEVRGRAFALNRLAVNLGWAIAPVLGGLVAGRIGYAWLFVGNALGCLLACVPLLVFARHPRRIVSSPPADGTPVLDRSPLRDPVFLTTLAVVMVSATGFLQILSTLPLFLRQEQEFTEETIGLVLAINPVLIVAFEMLLLRRIEGLRPLRVTATGVVLFGLGFGLLPHGVGFAWVAFTIVLWTIGEMLESPTMAAFVANRAGERRRGAYLGLYGTSFSISMLLAPILGTWVYDAYGPDVLWTSILVAMLVNACVLLVLDRIAGAAAAPR